MLFSGVLVTENEKKNSKIKINIRVGYEDNFPEKYYNLSLLPIPGENRNKEQHRKEQKIYKVIIGFAVKLQANC